MLSFVCYVMLCNVKLTLNWLKCSLMSVMCLLRECESEYLYVCARTHAVRAYVFDPRVSESLFCLLSTCLWRVEPGPLFARDSAAT